MWGKKERKPTPPMRLHYKPRLSRFSALQPEYYHTRYNLHKITESVPDCGGIIHRHGTVDVSPGHKERTGGSVCGDSAVQTVVRLLLACPHSCFPLSTMW